MNVSQIMTKGVISINPEENVRQALSFLFKKRISGLPVIDSQGSLVGMFTEKDVINQILPSYIEKVGNFVYVEEFKFIRKKLQSLENSSVAKVMRREVVTVDENTSLSEVARIMLTKKVRRIPVLGKDKRVVGIVAREDIVKAYAKEAGWEID